jgi:drug/metabolite transporter (DMT)-like permease
VNVARRDPLLGIALKICSVMTFMLMAACVKASSAEVPVWQVCFCRSFFALLTVAAFMAWQGDLRLAVHTSNPWGHLWRGVLGLTAMVLNFTALALLPLPDAIAIGYAMPLFVAIFAALLLGEVVRTFRWTAIAIGLLGVLIILWPRLAFLKGEGGTASDFLGAASALTGAVVVGLGTVVVSRLVAAERSSTVVFYFSLISSIGLLMTMPFGWKLPDAATGALLVGSGVLGAIGQLFMTHSYRFADTSTVAPFEYTSMLFGIAIGYFVFRELPTPTMLTGASVVISAGLIILWREHRLSAARPATAAAASPGTMTGTDKVERN